MNDAAHSFDLTAMRVLRRVVIRRWLGMLASTVGWALGAIAVTGLLRWGAWLPALIAMGWLAGTAVVAWRRRPGKYDALAFWDHTQGRSEAIAAAWWFSQQPSLTTMQTRHVEAQEKVLPEATQSLAKDLPLPIHRWLFAMPVVLAAMIALNLWKPAVPGDTPITDAMRETAKAEASKIAANDLTKKNLPGLTAAEKQAVEKLKQDVATTAKDLDKGEGTSARDLLMSLEKKARDVEALAKQIGADTQAWASEKMIAAMRQHADTADLGDAAASRNAAQTAKSAMDLANTLKSPQLTKETSDRLSETLRDIAKASEEGDSKRTVGKHVLAAGDHLPQGRVKEAADEFETLANLMRDKAQREQARKELEKLAQQLRDAGSKIAGQQSGSMQQMQGAQGQQQQQVQQMNQAMQQMLSQQQNGSQQPMQAPGLSQGQQQMMVQQSDGQAGSQGQQVGLAQGQPGDKNDGQKQQGKPTLFAPVPGAKPDDKAQTMVMNGAPPKDPSSAAAMSAPGGPQAGNGKAKLDAAPTAPPKAGQSATVNARSGNEGTSTTRSIEGGVRQEAANRTAEEMAVDLIHEQEAALDDAALPPARREQVRRYFQELRKRFEPQNK